MPKRNKPFSYRDVDRLQHEIYLKLVLNELGIDKTHFREYPTAPPGSRLLHSCDNCNYTVFLPKQEHTYLRPCEQCKETQTFTRTEN